MNCLDSATVTAFDTHWEVRLDLRFELFHSRDSLAITLEAASGAREVAIRVERGRVVDVAVWDADRTARVSLPFESTVLGTRELVCVVPRALLATEGMLARVQLNGALAGLATVSWVEAPAASGTAAAADELALAGA